MTATMLLDKLSDVGVSVTLDGGALILTGPVRRLPPELLAELKANKPAVVACLQKRDHAAVAERSGDKVPTVQADADRPAAPVPVRRVSERLAESDLHPADDPRLRAIRADLANRGVFLASDLVGDAPTTTATADTATPAEVQALIDAGKAWHPEAWRGELRRRSKLVSDPKLAERLAEAAETIERGLLR